MKKNFYYGLLLVSALCCNTINAEPQNDQGSEPNFEGTWFEDEQGNIIAPDETINIGDVVIMVIEANKAANGELANIDLEEMGCTYRLLSDQYKIHHGFINDIVINGDSYDPQQPDRQLKNQTRLRFQAIEETDHCLAGFEKARKERLAKTFCKKRSWPYRRWFNKHIRKCS